MTAIERMLIQLEETEKSFDSFWSRHENRLLQCLDLRKFEEEFRKVIRVLFYVYFVQFLTLKPIRAK